MIRDEVYSVKGSPATCYLSALKHIHRYHDEYVSEPDEMGKEYGPTVWVSEPIFISIDWHRAISGMDELIRISPISNKQAFEDYASQVCDGFNAEGFEYSYYERLFEHPTGLTQYGLNQMALILSRLEKYPQSRRAIASTWYQPKDLAQTTIHTPCLQLFQPQVNPKSGKLDLDTVWRSRDMFKAFPMNLFAIVNLWFRIAQELKVEPGIYRDYSIHPHVYAKDQSDIERLIKV